MIKKYSNQTLSTNLQYREATISLSLSLSLSLFSSR